MFKDIFISHAKEDIDWAEKLYDYLETHGYSPWLDKKKLKPGANWDYEIKGALRKASFVIILLSATSVEKRSYIQREFKLALEHSETKLTDDIYIIPILLDNCKVPVELSKFHWLEVTNDLWQEKILDALNYQREKYISNLSPEEVQLNDYTSMSIGLNLETNIPIEYSCDLPLFLKNQYFDASFINTFIQQKALEAINDLRSYVLEEQGFELSNELGWHYGISHNIYFLNKDYLSIKIEYNSYTGGAHPTTAIDTLNFKFQPDLLLRLRDVVQYYDLQEFVTEMISKYGDEDQKEHLVNYIEYLTEENVNFVFDEKTLEISMVNEVPRVIMALSSLIIPLADLKLRVRIS